MSEKGWNRGTAKRNTYRKNFLGFQINENTRKGAGFVCFGRSNDSQNHGRATPTILLRSNFVASYISTQISPLSRFLFPCHSCRISTDLNDVVTRFLAFRICLYVCSYDSGVRLVLFFGGARGRWLFGVSCFHVLIDSCCKSLAWPGRQHFSS